MSYHLNLSRTAGRLLALAALTSCQSLTSVVNPLVFAFQSGASNSRIVYRVLNMDDDVVFLPRCGDHMSPSIDRRSGDEWVNASGGICLTNVRMDPIPLDVAAAYQDSIRTMEPGTYRLRLAISRHSTMAPSETVVSQAFVIK